MNRLYEIVNSPVLMNVVYWSFLLLAAIHVSPYVLAALLVLAGFVSNDRVEVTDGSMTVEIEAKPGTLDEQQIRRAVKEAKNDATKNK